MNNVTEKFRFTDDQRLRFYIINGIKYPLIFTLLQNIRDDKTPEKDLYYLYIALFVIVVISVIIARYMIYDTKPLSFSIYYGLSEILFLGGLCGAYWAQRKYKDKKGVVLSIDLSILFIVLGLIAGGYYYTRK